MSGLSIKSHDSLWHASQGREEGWIYILVITAENITFYTWVKQDQPRNAHLGWKALLGQHSGVTHRWSTWRVVLISHFYRDVVCCLMWHPPHEHPGGNYSKSRKNHNSPCFFWVTSVLLSSSHQELLTEHVFLVLTAQKLRGKTMGVASVRTGSHLRTGGLSLSLISPYFSFPTNFLPSFFVWILIYVYLKATSKLFERRQAPTLDQQQSK